MHETVAIMGETGCDTTRFAPLVNPSQVTLVDFKSGDPESDKHQKLAEEEMRLQVALYAVAAKKELDYQPEQGLVRYLDAEDVTKAELSVLKRYRDELVRSVRCGCCFPRSTWS